MIDVVIGIDPGANKANGFSPYDLRRKIWREDIGQYRISYVLSRLAWYAQQPLKVKVILEDTSQMQQLYEKKMQPLYAAFKKLKQATSVSEFCSLSTDALRTCKMSIRISNNVGMNAGFSRVIQEWCLHLGLELELVVPSASSHTKLTAEEFLLVIPISKEQYPELYKNVSKGSSWQHLRDSMALIERYLPKTSPTLLIPGMPFPGEKPLSPYQQSVAASIARGTLNQQLKINKQKRRR